jgi:RNA 2',3'-cyclic 3'-phosphodiesterase
MALLQAIAAEVRGTRFALELDRVGSFRRARVAWVGCDSPPESIVALQAALSQRLRAAGFDLQDRPFAPHVTLVRKTLRAAPRARIEAIAWPVTEYALVASAAGRYATLASWRLG